MSFAHAVQPEDASFRLAMASSALGMAILDLDGSWREVNPAVGRMLGQDAADMAGRSAIEFVHPEDREPAMARLAALVAGRLQAIDEPLRLLHRDGSTAWVQCTVAVMRDAGNEPFKLVAQLRDIGAERAAQAMQRADARDSSAANDAANRQLQLFSDAVSHDLRAPLRSIESFAGLLADRLGDAVDSTSHDYLARVRAAAARMSSLLSALSELSDVTRVKLRPTSVDLSLLAEWVVAERREAEPERDAEIHVQPGLATHGDERLLKVLLSHLIGNAWKFSRECPSVRIGVEGEADASGAMHLRVIDAGCGFDMRYAHKLFEPFQRLHGPAEGGGHGLGLAIAQRVAERHGGQLTAECRPEGGSIFHLHLPAGTPAVPESGSSR